jgi:hypothetical protein
MESDTKLAPLIAFSNNSDEELLVVNSPKSKNQETKLIEKSTADKCIMTEPFYFIQSSLGHTLNESSLTPREDIIASSLIEKATSLSKSGTRLRSQALVRSACNYHASKSASIKESERESDPAIMYSDRLPDVSSSSSASSLFPFVVMPIAVSLKKFRKSDYRLNYNLDNQSDYYPNMTNESSINNISNLNNNNKVNNNINNINNSSSSYIKSGSGGLLCNNNANKSDTKLAHIVASVPSSPNQLEPQPIETQRNDSNQGSVAQRELWDRKIEFLLAIIGFSVDLGNIWRCNKRYIKNFKYSIINC